MTLRWWGLPPALPFAGIGKRQTACVCGAQPTQLSRAALHGVGGVAPVAGRTSSSSPHSPKCSNEAVLVATFHPTDPTALITCGKSHIYFWSLEGGSLSKRQGLFEVRAGGRRAGRDTQTDSWTLQRVPGAADHTAVACRGLGFLIRAVGMVLLDSHRVRIQWGGEFSSSQQVVHAQQVRAAGVDVTGKHREARERPAGGEEHAARETECEAEVPRRQDPGAPLTGLPCLWWESRLHPKKRDPGDGTDAEERVGQGWRGPWRQR